jgi:hypothetical protein
MAHGDLAQAAAVLGAAGSAASLLARDRRSVLFAGLCALLTAEITLALGLIPAHDLRRLTSPLLLAAFVGATCVVIALAVLLVRHPALTAPLLLVAAPFRVPVDLGDQHAFLLLPLYGVLAAAGLAFIIRTAGGGPLRTAPWLLAVPAATFIALSGISLLWSRDLEQGSIELLFFLLPFAALIAVVAGSPLPGWEPRVLATILVGLTAVFALIGIYQRLTHTLFYAPTLELSNTYTSFFRVSAVFKDPSIYGRYLAIGIALVLIAHWIGGLRLTVAAPVLVLLSIGLWLSYSQSSMAALFIVAVAITIVVGDRTARRAVAVFGVVSAVLVGALVLSHANGASAQRLTSDRSRLVDVTWVVIRHHPLVGVGVGGQPRASRDEAAQGSKIPSRNRSHTTPLTVVAELGGLGAAAYLLFIAAAAKLFYEAARRRLALGIGLGAVFLILLIHSLFYAGFFEDPLTWGTLAVAAAACGTSARRLPADDLKPLANPDDDGRRERTNVAGVVAPGEPQAVPPRR